MRRMAGSPRDLACSVLSRVVSLESVGPSFVAWARRIRQGSWKSPGVSEAARPGGGKKA
jgi:hypothetical protein